MKESIKDCSFCNLDKSKIYNTILDETKYFYVTPTLGSLVEGYILIISKRHINSMSLLNKEELSEYKFLIRKYRSKFKNIYGKFPIIFEHGSPNLDDINKANSVVHAHTHVVNHNYLNESDLINKLNFKLISKVEDISSNKNYIFYLNQNNMKYISYDSNFISQFMRIEIAKDLNILDKYNWKDYEFTNNVNLTIDKFSLIEKDI